MKIIEKPIANIKPSIFSTLRFFKLAPYSHVASVKAKLRNAEKKNIKLKEDNAKLKEDNAKLKEEKEKHTKNLVAYFSERTTSGDVDQVVRDVFSLAYNDEHLMLLQSSIFNSIIKIKEVCLAYEFKRKSAEFIVQMANSESSTLNSRVYAPAFYYVERFEDVLRLDESIYPGFSYIKGVSKIICQNDKKALSSRNLKRPQVMRSPDKKFDELIRGRRVCVVGPSPSELNNGSYIDEFDVIVRPNYTGPQDIYGFSKTHGSLTHVSYFNAPVAKFLNFNDISKNFEENSITGVFRNSQHFLRFGNHLPNSRYINPMPRTFASRFSFHGIQRIVLDLLHFEPDSIALFNLDFFTGLAGGKSNRISSYKTAGSHVGYFHDPLQGLRLIRYLREAELISVDALIEEILHWSDKDYLNHLEDLEKNKADFLINTNRLNARR